MLFPASSYPSSSSDPPPVSSAPQGSGAEPYIDVYFELESFLSHTPPLLTLEKVSKGGSRAHACRKPTWYDLHLAPDLVLKHFVHVKHLHQKIAGFVDRRLEELKEQGIQPLPTDPAILQLAHLQDTQIHGKPRAMKNEAEVVQYLKDVTIIRKNFASSRSTYD